MLRSRWRRVGSVGLCLFLSVVLVAEVVYLLRRPLLERWLCSEIAAALGPALAGRVEVGSIGGSWITNLDVQGIAIAGNGTVKELQGGSLQVALDPVALLRGDLGGLVQVRVHANSLHIDLDAVSEPATEPPQEPAAPPDLEALAALLPRGAVIAVENLVLTGRGERYAGAAHIALLPAVEGAARLVTLELPGIDADVSLLRDGAAAVDLQARNVARLSRLFAGPAALRGGDAALHVDVRLQPALELTAKAHIDGLDAAERPVRRLEASVQLDAAGLQRLEVAVETEGLRLFAQGVSLRFAEGLASLTGDVGLDLDDLAPYCVLLPPQLRELLPITGSLRAHAEGGRLQIAAGGLQCAAAALRVEQGALRLAGTPGIAADAPLRAVVTLLDAARLPLPAGLPLSPRGGRVGIELADRDGALALAVDFDVALADGDGRTGRLHGNVAAAHGASTTCAPHAVLEGDVLRGAASALRLDASAELGSDRCRFGIDLDLGPLGAVTVHAGADERDFAIEQVRATTPAGAISLQGRIAGLGARALRGGALDAATLHPELDAEFDLGALDRLDLAAFTDLRLLGSLRGRASVRGTGSAPELAAEVDAQGLGASLAAGALAQNLDARIVLRDRSLRIETLQGSVAGQQLTVTGEFAATDAGFAVRDVTLRTPDGGVVALAGRIGSGGSLHATLGSTELQLRLDTVPLDPWLQFAGMQPCGAQVAGHLHWQPAATPPLHVRLEATAARLRAGEREVPARLLLEVEGDEQSTRLALEGTCGALRLDGKGSLALAPLAALADPDGLRDAAVALELTVPATDLAAVPAQLLGCNELTGQLSLAIRLGGTLRRPEPTASIDLQGGSLLAAGQRIDEMRAKVRVTETGVHIEQLHCSRGAGPIDVQGAFTAPGPLWSHWQQASIDFTVRGENVLLHRRTGLKVRGDIDLKAQGPLAAMAIAGTVALHDCKMLTRIPLLDWRTTGGRATTSGIVIPGLDLGPHVAGTLDVRITTKEPFAIANNILDGALNVELALRGALSNPQLEGTVSGPETQLILPGMKLRASALLVEWSRSEPHYPTITVNARGRRMGYDVNIVVRGRYDRPDVVMSSDPVLPPDDLLVLVTTGARPDSTSGGAGVGAVLGAYLAQELADWIFGSESTEAKESFLDRFSIETGTEISKGGSESIVVEFRIADRIYMQGERDIYEDINMGVVYRLRFR